MSKRNRRAFKDGLMSVYEVVTKNNKDEILPIANVRYEKLTVGIKRFYTALQANEKVDYLLSCPMHAPINSKNVIVLNDGLQYNIVQLQFLDDTFPASMSLTLQQRKTLYKIGKTEGEEP